MKNQKLTLTIASIALFSSVFAQTAWDTQGNTLNSGDWIGSQNGFPLQLRTDLAEPIIFQTNGANERMRLTQTGELFRTDGAAANTNRWRLFTTYTNSSKSLKNSFGLI